MSLEETRQHTGESESCAGWHQYSVPEPVGLPPRRLSPEEAASVPQAGRSLNNHLLAEARPPRSTVCMKRLWWSCFGQEMIVWSRVQADMRITDRHIRTPFSCTVSPSTVRRLQFHDLRSGANKRRRRKLCCAALTAISERVQKAISDECRSHPKIRFRVVTSSTLLASFADLLGGSVIFSGSDASYAAEGQFCRQGSIAAESAKPSLRRKTAERKMSAESDVALSLNLLSVPHVLSVMWRTVSLLYWYEATQRGLWDGSGRDLGRLLTGLCLSELADGPIAYFPFNRAAVLVIKVLNQGLLCSLLFQVHSMRESRAVPMSGRHRVCFALMVENCAAFRLSWNYVQTAELASGLLSQVLGLGPAVLPPLHLALLAACVLATAYTELAFLQKFRWTFAAHIPIQLWAASLYQQSALSGRILCVLVVLNALLVVKKLVACKETAPKKHQCLKDVDEQLLEV
ncbi:hypothetical protein Bbelb_401130 [Branchiostoma belcheri]|nr:hypothetical protein Bbelb_401130 [Branchiostoma belcheri]